MEKREMHTKIIGDIKICEYLDSTLQAVLIPRSLLKSIKDVSECSNLDGTGIYFLFGDFDELGKVETYIGESEQVLKRLSEHKETLEWNSCVYILSSKNQFNKAYIKYLESQFISKAVLSKKVRLLNSYNSQNIQLEYGKITLDRFIPDVEGYLSALGYPLFEKLDENTELTFYCNTENGTAKGRYIGGKFKVLKNSHAKFGESSSMSPHNVLLKNTLINSGILQKSNRTCVFTEDYEFNSASAAACVVKGANVSGWTVWKTSDGRTLKDVY
ncbi:GIY-YIG nuclease family protein [Methanococcus maripaludis]|jgi:hypothetical protein|uniref:DUF4357 domain-containing protein n=1 Tax=Methanococcus maripaludis OS7 TaxID=637915 RepID=A0A2Z5PIS9_METMI|nr:GIY-YIG nuclease family protein [Methanococcus maripaludis]BAP62883.1 hypothetical protein MMOS7_07970 [Methanococcus maripaludis OS7]